MEERDCATETDVQVNLRNEECAVGTEGKYHAATKDVQVLLVREECAVGMAQRGCAATKDVQVMFRKEGEWMCFKIKHPVRLISFLHGTPPLGRWMNDAKRCKIEIRLHPVSWRSALLGHWKKKKFIAVDIFINHWINLYNLRCSPACNASSGLI
eukprot:scaffold13853_cov82-Skeletonema_marinoi.AAC.2